MQIIKDQQIIDNTWQYIADDQPLPATGDITVSLTRWQQEKTQLLQRNTPLGVRLEPSDSAYALENDLQHLALIEVNFPIYTAGQGFSHARLLRGRYKFKGEIRAVGQFIVDQVYYLSRVGVNGFALENPKQLEFALSTLDDFSASYQVYSA